VPSPTLLLLLLGAAVLAGAMVIARTKGLWPWRRESNITPGYAAEQILETMKSAVIVSDMEGRIRVANHAAERLLGYDRRELLVTRLREILGGEEGRTTGRLISTSGVLEHPMRWRMRQGVTVDVLAASSLLRSDRGMPIGVVYVASDFTERKRAEDALRQSEARYRLLFERNLAGVYRSTIDGGVLECNDACARIFGFETRDAFVSAGAHDRYFDADDRERVMQILREHKQVNNYELRMRRRDGSPVWVIESATLLEGGEIEGTLIDITDRKRAQEQIEYQAYHDALTGLPNRLLFRDRITVALPHARRNQRMSAVMFLDLDQFKNVNDTLGHTVGDRLLQEIASRIKANVRAGDTLARMGGDEFTILLAEVRELEGAVTAARKILDAVRQPVRIDDHELHVTTSIGIAVYPRDGEDAETLLRNADAAMYRAKELGRDNVQFASSRIDPVAAAQEPIVRATASGSVDPDPGTT
jgi:diguanylate cyclase (GGDEF)-like protein/PAS domain S-box-containing protein